MKNLKITLIVLVVLTLIASFVSTSVGVYAVMAILALAVLKFIGVSFYFMELRKGHLFWKGTLLAFLVVFMISIVVII